ncbi:MAG: efflux RND transporter periplasmic adaptor subunit [candidate division WOR-3 bacterium]|nr:MAG: efflux RND transporter periplasmic adaptor subunit [candidate division WOR-3 bacterium]
MKRRTRTTLIVVGIAILLAVIVVLNLTRKEAGEKVDTKEVAFGSILSQVSATGELKAKAQVNLQAQVMGVIEQLYVDEGDRVDQGDLLLELDRGRYQAQMVLARSRYTQAKLSHARVDSLFGRRLVSEEQYEASKAAYEMAKAQYEEAEDSYAKTSIRAPIRGKVAKVNVEEGETVIIGTMNNPGTVIMVIADMSRMEAIVEVDETDVVSLRIGQHADIEVDAFPDTTFAGTVTKIGYMPLQNLLSTEVEGVDFEVEVTLDSTVPELRPGMTVSVDITTASLDSVLKVPIQAVGRREIDDEEKETVFTVEEGKATLRPVRTGKSSDTDIEITEGLDPGEEIITGPYKVLSKLKEGKKVTPGKKKDKEDEQRREAEASDSIGD